MNTTQVLPDTAFKEDIRKGLQAYPKYLYSKYIYDKNGDRLFQEIMKLPEYYLTNCELEILQRQSEEIAHRFYENGSGFDLIELGAGDGTKTTILLRQLLNNKVDFNYKPIDISQNAIEKLSDRLLSELPGLSVQPETGEYFEVLDRLKEYDSRKKVILFLGSNIGNLLHPRAIEFLSHMREAMNDDDLLFIGFDQKKEPAVVLEAYNDTAGVTEAFNKNLLSRINTELGGNFDLDSFKHWEVYDPETGTAKSYLVSVKKQHVYIEALEIDVSFEAWETIHTEISQKYDHKTIEWLAEKSDLEIIDSFTDSKNYYKNYLFRKK